MRRSLSSLSLLVALAAPLGAQTMDDGLLLKARELRVGVEVGYDRWQEYWEGSLKRTNGNVGTVSTRAVTTEASFGVTKDLTLLATLPYIATNASQGVLEGQRGAQDISVALKYRFFKGTLASRVRLSSALLIGVAAPTTSYTPDFLPMSIGSASRRGTVRASFHAADRTGFFADASFGETRRSNVTLDRPAYYTNGQLTLSDQVALPNVRDAQFSLGYQDAQWCIPLSIVQQRTQGGGDIRRQDMPFVSNRMDFTRVSARVMYTLPRWTRMIVGAGAAHVLQGRNVGQSTTVMGGVTYVFGR